jgi:hypothetical protein
MPPFRTEYAVICEETREEAGGKTTILGLFGPSPHATIEVPQFGPFPRLTVVMWAPPPTAEQTLALRATFGVKGEQPFVDVPNMTFQIHPGKTIQLVFALANLPLTKAGRYAFVLRSGGDVVGTAEFALRLQTAKSLQV